MSALPTEAVVAVLAVAALALLAVLAWAADRLTATPAPRRRVSAAAGYAGHDLIPAHVALVHDPACRACAVYDRTLDEGKEVEFELKTGPKGLQAENVTLPL